MPVSAASLLSRSVGGGGGGTFVLLTTSALTLRRTGARGGIIRMRSDDFSSPFFSASASASAAAVLLARRRSLLFPSSPPPPATVSRSRCHQLSCLAPQANSNLPAAVEVDGEDGAAVPPPAAAPTDPVREAAGLLDIRVGRVLRAWRHPEADSLYVEEVDVGEVEPRTICSGLVGYVLLEALEGARVAVLANLKPRNMRGVKSNGMLLAASDAAHETVELLVAPEGAAPGERVWFGAQEDQPEPATPNQVQKKKIWESVQPHLKTDENFVAMLGVHRMQTSAGVVVCRSLKNASIS